MKGKQVCLMFASLCAVSFCGCYNMRTDPNESLDKVTFGEVLEHYLLFAHDCRRSPEECIPICIEDQKQFDRNQAEEQRKWEAFKNMPPYRPNRTGILLMDQLNEILAEISIQIRHEVVIPYKELAEQGHIEAYKVFRADVNHIMDTSGIDRKSAVLRTYTYWKNRYGEERCQQLLAAFPVIERLRADQQLGRVIARNQKRIADLIQHIPQAVDQLKAAAKDVNGIIAITNAGVQTLHIAQRLETALDYLGEFQREKYQEVLDIKAAIESIQKYNNNEI